MTTRNDVTPVWSTSPRVLEVAAPSTEFIVQDVVDTVRKLEDRFDGMGFDHLLNAAGKEDLGGGVQVGITATLQDAKVAFEGRTTAAQTGTVTGAPIAPITNQQIMQDTSATFVTNLVARGSLVINFSDQSIAEVISVDSQTQLTTKTLTNGITNTYVVNDAYQVFNIIQCTASGGNLVAVNSVGSAFSPILPTAFTQVVLTASSSATTQNQEALEAAAFDGGVAFDPTSANTGTGFPIGTREFAVNNFSDVHAIAQARGLRKVFVISDATLNGIDTSGVHHIWIGDNRNVVLTINPSATLTNNAFQTIRISGDMGGNNTLQQCDIVDGSSFSGHAFHCAFEGTTTLTGNTEIESSVSAKPGDGHPDFIVGSSILQVRDWHGSLGAHGVTSGIHTIEIYGGRMHVDAASTGGTLHLRGFPSAATNDQSTGTVVLDQTGMAQIWNHVIDGTFTAEEVMRLIGSAAAAKASGLDVLNPIYRDIADTKNRITAVTDALGNRTSITLDVTK